MMAKHCGKVGKHDHHEWEERVGAKVHQTMTNWCAGVGGGR